MSIHIGFERAGWAGLIAGGLCFTLPAVSIVLGMAWLYVRYQSTPQLTWLLYWIKPVIIAIILQALWNLGKKAFNNLLAVVLGVERSRAVLLGYQRAGASFGRWHAH